MIFNRDVSIYMYCQECKCFDYHSKNENGQNLSCYKCYTVNGKIWFKDEE